MTVNESTAEGARARWFTGFFKCRAWYNNHSIKSRSNSGERTEGVLLQYELKLANTFSVLRNSCNSVNIPPSELCCIKTSLWLQEEEGCLFRKSFHLKVDNRPLNKMIHCCLNGTQWHQAKL